jgi:hypothetical protein
VDKFAADRHRQFGRPRAVQTIWVATPNIVASRCRTVIEPIAEAALLLRRRRELVPLLICRHAGDPALSA